MVKALLKKQLLEVLSPFYRNRKTGKTRSGAALVGFILLYAVLFGYLGFIFYMLADFLCAPFAAAGMSWFYFALMGLIAVAFGVLGSVFNTYASLYTAKDNDTLLSMPIPPRYILISRLGGVYFMGLLYESVVMIPTLIVFFLNVRVNVPGVIFTLIIPVVLSAFILSLSCILGFFVALIASRMKNKNFIAVAVSLIFIVGYYYIYSKAYDLLGRLVADPTLLGDGVKSALYLFYHMGLAAEGRLLSMALFTGVIAALFLVVVTVLSRSFLSIATTNKGAPTVKYKKARLRSGSLRFALLRKEFSRFTGSATYMLNCGLGTVMTVVAAVFLIVKGGDLRNVLEMLPGIGEGIVALIATAALCMVSSMNTMTAPSVSLEGRHIWILQTLPVPARAALMAKAKLHLILTLPPAMLLVIATIATLRIKWYFALLMALTSTLFICLVALGGLALNLKLPNLSWTSETVPVKQSASVTLTIFGSWAVILALGGLYIPLRHVISPLLYVIGVDVIFAVSAMLLYRWTVTRGARIFEKL